MAAKNFPEISVIIPLYNAEKYIGACLESLANQTFQDFEVIVADDCSTDKSAMVVKSFISTFGDRLRLVKLSKNSGVPSTPRNFALKKARGKYVYYLDSDDLLTPTAFEELGTRSRIFSCRNASESLRKNLSPAIIALARFTIFCARKFFRATLKTSLR